MLMIGVIVRGVKNAFRNLARTASVIFILAISIGLSLIMLLSYTTVQARIDSVKSSIGNIITLRPAGSSDFQGGGNPLTNEQMTQVKGLPHVIRVVSSINDRLTPTTDTSLQSAIDPGTLGNRNGRFGQRMFFITNGDNTQRPTTFSIPILVTGVSDPSTILSNGTTLTSGKLFTANSTNNVAIVGKGLAAKNNLSVGSTFTAYSNTTMTVVGIYDAGNTFNNANMYMPLATLQTLSQQTDNITAATVTVDSINNVNSIAIAITNALGASNVDVTTAQDQATQALAPLESIESISLYSLFGALIAGAVITLLTMIMIVRERKKEIGVLKAIGASNAIVVMQFISESLVFALLASVVGIVIGVLLSNPVLNALVKSTQTQGMMVAGQGGFGGGFRAIRGLGGQLGGSVVSSFNSLHATVGLSIILYGLIAAVVIAVLGSAIPAFLIARIRPAEVMRSE